MKSYKGVDVYEQESVSINNPTPTPPPPPPPTTKKKKNQSTTEWEGRERWGQLVGEKMGYRVQEIPMRGH